MVRIPSAFAVFATLACVPGLAVPSTAQNIAIRTLALRAGDLPQLHVKSEKQHLPLVFSATQPSEPLDALAANPLPLYRSETDAKGQQSFVVSYKVPLPAGAQGILLLGWTTGRETRYVAIKDDFASARYNDWLLINASSKPIAFQMGDANKPLLLKPGVTATHRITETKGVGIPVLAQAPFDGKPKTFYSTYWPVYPDRRSLVLFVDDGRKIVVKRISDQLAAAHPGKKPR